MYCHVSLQIMWSSHPKKSHILYKQKICPQSSLQISFTVPAYQCKSSSPMNCVESTVLIPNYENLNCFIHFSWGSPHTAIVEEVFSSKIHFALLPQTKRKSVTQCDRRWWQFKYLDCHPENAQQWVVNTHRIS